MKIIFLDFDGVIVTRESLAKADKIETKAIRKGKELSDLKAHVIQASPDCIVQLNRIIEKTDARVVVSSAWRVGRNTKQLQEILTCMGANVEVIDRTGSPQPHMRRGQIIQEWLDNNDPPDSYVVIDDGWIWDHDTRFVKTTWERGLTRKAANKAIEILNKKKS